MARLVSQKSSGDISVVGLALTRAQCRLASRSRDRRFDGRFFVAVHTTGIYCRPVCPAPTPRAEHVAYYPHAAAAEAGGFRPCLRCRPELAPGAPGWPLGEATVQRGLRLIADGALAEGSIGDLCERLGLGERHVRRLFLRSVGATPSQVHATQRLLFAKQLLTDTQLPIAAVAEAAGYGSVRRLETCFAEAYRLAPRALRREHASRPPADAAIVLRLPVRPPYDFAALLAFLRTRALPGVETVDGRSYCRRGVASPPDSEVVVTFDQTRQTLQVELRAVPTEAIAAVVRRVRRVFDVDADPSAIALGLSRDRVLRRLVTQAPGLRVPGGWDAFEVAVRAVVGQQVSVAAAITLLARVRARAGRLTPAALAGCDLTGLGLTGARVAALAELARRAQAQTVLAPDATLDDAVAALTACPGIGAWTAHYVAMRGLGHPDAFIGGDLIVARSYAHHAQRLRTAPPLRVAAETWRPWRAYAVMHLWHAAPKPPARRPIAKKGSRP